MKTESEAKWLDRIVVVMISMAFLFAILSAVYPSRAIPWIQNHVFLLDVFALIVAFILLVWMLKGGVYSPIWKWMPPFCFFKKAVWLRFTIVIGMILGTIAGIIAGHYGGSF